MGLVGFYALLYNPFMQVSVIIVNYNTKELILNCLKSIYEKTSDIDFEVIVVDNASSDASCEAIAQEFPQVKLIKSVVNLGFGRANNLGISNSEAEYVFLLNPDTVLINNAIKILYDSITFTPNCGVMGGNLFDENMMSVHSFGYLLSLSRYILRIFGFRYLLKNRKNDQNRNEFQKVEQIIGADMMISRHVLDDVGGFDERFFLYLEESELQYRIQKNGYDIYYTPEAHIHHFEGGVTKKNKPFKRQMIAQSEYLYLTLSTNVPKFLLRLVCSLPLFYRLFISPVYALRALKYIWTT